MFKLICTLIFFFAVCESTPLNGSEFMWVVVQDPAEESEIIAYEINETNDIENNGDGVGDEEDDDVKQNPYARTQNINYFAERSSFNGQRSYAIGAFRKVNWYTAQQYCASQGLTLASVNTAREADTLRSFLYENNMVKENINFWLSGTDLAEYRNWHWFANGRPLLFENWSQSEPSNRGRCISMDGNGRWKATDCNTNEFFVCENRCASVF